MSLYYIIVIIIIVSLYFVYNDYRARNDPMILQLKHDLIRIDPRAEFLTFYKKDESYSINKRKIYLCVEDEHGDYYSKNTLMYVSLHELSHCLNKFDVGHTESFHRIFKQLLDRATKMRLYNPNLEIPTNYCTYKKNK